MVEVAPNCVANCPFCMHLGVCVTSCPEKHTCALNGVCVLDSPTNFCDISCKSCNVNNAINGCTDCPLN